MRCYCCNNILTTQETNRKFKESGNYTEMCNTCLVSIETSYDIESEDGADPRDDSEGEEE
jgi:hypothetical protein